MLRLLSTNIKVQKMNEFELILTKNIFLVSVILPHFLESFINILRVHVSDVSQNILQCVLHTFSHADLTTNVNISSFPKHDDEKYLFCGKYSESFFYLTHISYILAASLVSKFWTYCLGWFGSLE